MPYFLADLWKVSLTHLTEDEVWAHYEQCLKEHDWTFNYSDDAGAYRAGQDQASHLEKVRTYCSSLDKELADQLFFKYSFWHNDDGSRKEFS